MKKRILIVDDDAAIGDMLEELLERNGYSPLRAYTGAEALEIVSAAPPDLVLLDLMLPDLNGEEALPRIGSVPVIAVSAKADIEDKVSVLSNGAADYITKPFDTKELLARVGVQLRRRESGGALSYGNIRLTPSDFSVTVLGAPIKLTKSEYAILYTLMKNDGRVVTRERIMADVESLTPDCEENSLRTHIGNLRQKLRRADGNDYIEAVWGIGYKLRS